MTPLETLRSVEHILATTPPIQFPFAKHVILEMITDTLRRTERLSQSMVSNEGETRRQTKHTLDRGVRPEDEATQVGEEGTTSENP